jgi:class 3 adenylate cyclase
VRQLDGIVDEALRQHRGVLVPAPLGVYCIAFSASEAAFDAALAVLSAWRAHESPSALRSSIHEGPCIAATRGRRVEYFGKTVHRALALLDDTVPGGVALSDSVASEREVAARMHELQLACEVTSSEHGPYIGMRITRVKPPPAPAAGHPPAPDGCSIRQ